MGQSIANGVSRGEVLIVNDAAESLTLLCDLLGQHGYSVRAAPSGELALWSAVSHKPDLMILDVRMPGMDGFEVCRRLKADPRTTDVPVIFITAQSDIEDKVHGLQVGGVDFIGKPFSSEEVLQRVANHVALSRATRELAQEKQSLEIRVRQRTAELEETAHALRAEVAAHRVAQGKLRLAASAFDASLSSMFITDAKGIIVAVNPAFSATTGYSFDQCLGQHISMLHSGKNEPAFYQQIRDTAEAGDKWSGEIWYRRRDSNEFPCLHTIATVRDGGRAIVNYVGVFLDLSESKDAQALIEFLTRHDSLTGLPNRMLVRDRFNQLVSAAPAGESIAVLCLNISRFRLINDIHGYSVGNEILQWVAGQLAECLTTKDLIFRESGDEFFLVHSEQSSLLGIRLLIEAIEARFQPELKVDDVRVALSAKLGVALYPADGENFDELAANASIAMERAKAQDAENYAFFTELLDQNVRARFNIAQHLRRALENQEFSVHYQPQVLAASEQIVGAEALLRWHSPVLGNVSPAQFIPIAEETGLIVDVGAWVLRTVCRQIAAWQAQGISNFKVAVNLSANQFMRDDIVETVESSLADSGIAPSSLELEITESTIIKDVQYAIDIMKKIKAMGVSISLDDFGTGYSSLSYLKKFPLDYLKIDQSFVRDLLDDGDADAIVLSIIGLAHHMRMKVIAEGVETAQQRDFLAQHGCDLLQGYFFGKPAPAELFMPRLASQKLESALGAQ